MNPYYLSIMFVNRFIYYLLPSDFHVISMSISLNGLDTYISGMIVLVGESGSGKDTVLNELVKRYGYHKIISHTTRAKREDDADDAYFFSSKEEFEQQMQDDEVFEWTEFNGNLYWTTQTDYINVGESAIVVDPVGAKKLKKEFTEAFIIYLNCPDRVRRERVGDARVDRDQDAFYNFPCDYMIRSDRPITEILMAIDEALEEFR